MAASSLRCSSADTSAGSHRCGMGRSPGARYALGLPIATPFSRERLRPHNLRVKSAHRHNLWVKVVATVFEGRALRSFGLNLLITRGSKRCRDKETFGQSVGELPYGVGKGAQERLPRRDRVKTGRLQTLGGTGVKTRSPRRRGLGVCYNPRVA